MTGVSYERVDDVMGLFSLIDIDQEGLSTVQAYQTSLPDLGGVTLFHEFAAAIADLRVCLSNLAFGHNTFILSINGKEEPMTHTGIAQLDLSALQQQEQTEIELLASASRQRLGRVTFALVPAAVGELV